MTEPAQPATQDGQPGRGWLRRWRTIVGLLISAACLVWIARTIDWSQVGQKLRGITWAEVPWLVAGVGAVVLSIPVRAWRWSVLLSPHRVSFLRLLTAMLVGQTLNYFVPARAGDVARAYWLEDRGSALPGRALGTIVVEKLLDVLALLLVVTLSPLWVAFPDWLVAPAYALAALSLALLACVILGAVLRTQALRVVQWVSRWLPASWGQAVQFFAAALLDGLATLRPGSGRLWRALLGTFAVWALGTSVHLAVFCAVGIPPALGTALLLSAALRVGTGVPTVPGRVGVYEGIHIACLGLFGVDAETSLSCGLITHAVDYGPPILLTAVLVWLDHGPGRAPH